MGVLNSFTFPNPETQKEKCRICKSAKQRGGPHEQPNASKINENTFFLSPTISACTRQVEASSNKYYESCLGSDCPAFCENAVKTKIKDNTIPGKQYCLYGH